MKVRFMVDGLGDLYGVMEKIERFGKVSKVIAMTRERFLRCLHNPHHSLRRTSALAIL